MGLDLKNIGPRLDPHTQISTRCRFPPLQTGEWGRLVGTKNELEAARVAYTDQRVIASQVRRRWRLRISCVAPIGREPLAGRSAEELRDKVRVQGQRCEKSAAERKLAGAANDSFTKKCISDALMRCASVIGAIDAQSHKSEETTGTAGAPANLRRAHDEHRPLLWEAAQIGDAFDAPAPARQPSVVSGEDRRGAEVQR